MHFSNRAYVLMGKVAIVCLFAFFLAPVDSANAQEGGKFVTKTFTGIGIGSNPVKKWAIIDARGSGSVDAYRQAKAWEASLPIGSARSGLPKVTDYNQTVLFLNGV